MLTCKLMDLPGESHRRGERGLPDEPMLSESLQKMVLEWIGMTPPRRMLRQLRKILISWMLHEQSGFPTDFEEIITDLDGLFELLDAIQEEIDGGDGEGKKEEMEEME